MDRYSSETLAVMSPGGTEGNLKVWWFYRDGKCLYWKLDFSSENLTLEGSFRFLASILQVLFLLQVKMKTSKFGGCNCYGNSSTCVLSCFPMERVVCSNVVKPLKFICEIWTVGSTGITWNNFQVW